eukprot:403368501
MAKAQYNNEEFTFLGDLTKNSEFERKLDDFFERQMAMGKSPEDIMKEALNGMHIDQDQFDKLGTQEDNESHTDRKNTVKKTVKTIETIKVSDTNPFKAQQSGQDAQDTQEYSEEEIEEEIEGNKIELDLEKLNIDPAVFQEFEQLMDKRMSDPAMRDTYEQSIREELKMLGISEERYQEMIKGSIFDKGVQKKDIGSGTKESISGQDVIYLGEPQEEETIDDEEAQLLKEMGSTKAGDSKGKQDDRKSENIQDIRKNIFNKK